MIISTLNNIFDFHKPINLDRPIGHQSIIDHVPLEIEYQISLRGLYQHTHTPIVVVGPRFVLYREAYFYPIPHPPANV